MSHQAFIFFRVIPDIVNRESILVSFLMNPHYQQSGMTEKETAFSFFSAFSSFSHF